MTDPHPVTVLRGDLPCPGVRIGQVAAYEFDIPEHVYVRPGAGRGQRAFLLLDESAQLHQPVVFKPVRAGWWYVDLVEIRDEGDTIHVADRYVDIIVGPPGQPYRIIDLHELADALTEGALSAAQVAQVLTATQTFVDRHLQGANHHGPDWPDFPPPPWPPCSDPVFVRSLEYEERFRRGADLHGTGPPGQGARQPGATAPARRAGLG